MMFCTKLHALGVQFMISNSNGDYIKKLYNASFLHINIIKAPRSVSCKAVDRNAVEEQTITL